MPATRFSVALVVVKKICTPSSAARPSVSNDSKGYIPLFPGRFPFYPPVLSFPLFIPASLSFRHETSLPVYRAIRNVKFCHDRGFRRLFLVKRWNLGQVAVRRRTRACKIKGVLAFFPRKANHHSPGHDTQSGEKVVCTQERLVIKLTRLVRPFDVESFILICRH